MRWWRAARAKEGKKVIVLKIRRRRSDVILGVVLGLGYGRCRRFI